MTSRYFRILLIAFTVLTVYKSWAQRNCGTTEYDEFLLQSDPQYKINRSIIDRHTKAINNQKSSLRTSGIITIPVVFHVVYNTSAENVSDAQILSQLDILNEDFRRLNADADNVWSQAADSEIEFCLASQDPYGNPTSGINRKYTNKTSFAYPSEETLMKYYNLDGIDAWPSNQYLNIWICDLGGGFLGFAQFPGGPSATDGVVIDYEYLGNIGTVSTPFHLGRTGTHEVGHWLNLRHIWGDGICGIDDEVTDTPESDASNGGCKIGHESCGTVDMVQNYMDYSDDDCMNLFTLGQKQRMRALFEPGGFREGLLTSSGCTEPEYTCIDGIHNGSEYGIDCGGPDCGSCPPCIELVIDITLDSNPEETSWDLKDKNGNTLATGGPYINSISGESITETICLTPECYELTIYDSGAEGMCCSALENGQYKINLNGVEIKSGASFGLLERTIFHTYSYYEFLGNVDIDWYNGENWNTCSSPPEGYMGQIIISENCINSRLDPFTLEAELIVKSGVTLTCQ